MLFHLKIISGAQEIDFISADFEFADNHFENNFDFNQIFSFELFKDFSKYNSFDSLVSPRIKPKSNTLGVSLKESILKEIDINLPKLQDLKIINQFDTTPEGVTQMADILSRLSRLEILET